MQVQCRIVKRFGLCGLCENPEQPCASATTVLNELNQNTQDRFDHKAATCRLTELALLRRELKQAYDKIRELE